MADVVRLIDITDGGSAGGSPPRWNFDIQVTDGDGEYIEEQADVIIQAFDLDNGCELAAATDALVYVPKAGGVGSIIQGVTGPLVLARTDATGLIQAQLEDVADANIRIQIVVSFLDEFTANGQSTLKVTF